MKKTIITIAVLLMSLIAITGCGNADEVYLDVESAVDEPESVIPEAPNTRLPSVFVNNILYLFLTTVRIMFLSLTIHGCILAISKAQFRCPNYQRKIFNQIIIR